MALTPALRAIGTNWMKWGSYLLPSIKWARLEGTVFNLDLALGPTAKKDIQIPLLKVILKLEFFNKELKLCSFDILQL